MNLNTKEFFIIAGPCVAENKEICFQIAEKLVEIRDKFKINIIFKASFLKANRSSIESYRGPGIEEGLTLLKEVKETYNLPIITDVHEPSEIKEVAKVADIIQIPAFLCRQTKLLETAAQTNLWINVKKGQFLAPWDVKNIYDKISYFNNQKILITERGTTFGYNNLVIDYRGIIMMLREGFDLIFDATHSIQTPSSKGKTSGGDRSFAAPLAYAAASLGVKGFFFETHPTPDNALCDGPNSVSLNSLEKIIKNLILLTSQYDDVISKI